MREYKTVINVSVIQIMEDMELLIIVTKNVQVSLLKYVEDPGLTMSMG